MRKNRIADQLLALVTTPDRAASTAGDLMEQAGVRGNFWFWSSVVRTAAALVWRTFAAEPANLLWLGFRGSLLNLLLGNVAQLGVVAALLILGSPGHAPDWPRYFEQWGVRWTYYAVIFGLPILFSFFVGRHIARKAPGREVPAGVALVITQIVTSALFSAAVAVLDARRIKPPSGNWYAPSDIIPLTIVASVSCLMANLAGAIRARRQVAG